MAKFNIIRWDDVDIDFRLLDQDNVAAINFIDVTGSSGDLSIGRTDASSVIVSKSGSSVILSGSSLLFDARVTGSIDLPGQQAFKLDGVAISTNQFTALNLSKLFNGSDVGVLHTHTLTASLDNVNIPRTFIVESGLTGTQIIFMKGASAQSASSKFVDSTRIVGIVSGSTSIKYNSGTIAKVFTGYGDVVDNFSSLIPGTQYYLGFTGSLTTSSTIGVSSAIVRVGIAKSSSSIIFQPEVVLKAFAQN